MASYVQIDPYGCGCTECLTGEYLPLERADDGDIAGLFAGRLSDATGEQFTITTTNTGRSEQIRAGNGSIEVTVTANYCGRSWSWTA